MHNYAFMHVNLELCLVIIKVLCSFIYFTLFSAKMLIMFRAKGEVWSMVLWEGTLIYHI